jgi:Zn-dependent peptidase ImmA (M78 family)
MSWSRLRAGLTEFELAKSLPVKAEKILEWEAGESQPTFRQAQQWAALAHVPFGFLFLKAPPQDALALPDLRTVGGVAPAKPSIDLLDTVRDVMRKQAWFLDYLKEQQQAPLPFVGKFSVSSSVAEVVADIRKTLNVDALPVQKGSDEYMRQLIAAADSAGILVMRSGMVGSNTHRKLDVGEFRGFALSDALAPVIFINIADAPTARVFTLIHELAHLWIGSSGVSSVAPSSSRKDEVFCNAVAGDFLVPEGQFRRVWRAVEDWVGLLPQLAATFHVSRLVIARRACDLGLISNAAYSEYYRNELETFREKKGSGGSFYRSAGARNSKRFSRAVISETLSGRLLLRDAGKLLGVQPAKIRTYAEKVDE